MLARCPPFVPEAARIYEAYNELDRDPMNGCPTVSGMRAVLDEYGWTDPGERKELRRLWRAMYAVEHEVREEQRKKGKPEKDEDDED